MFQLFTFKIYHWLVKYYIKLVYIDFFFLTVTLLAKLIKYIRSLKKNIFFVIYRFIIHTPSCLITRITYITCVLLIDFQPLLQQYIIIWYDSHFKLSLWFLQYFWYFNILKLFIYFLWKFFQLNFFPNVQILIFSKPQSNQLFQAFWLYLYCFFINYFFKCVFIPSSWKDNGNIKKVIFSVYYTNLCMY